MNKTGSPRKFDHDEILRLYDQGLNATEVAEAVGCSGGLVSKITRENGRTRPFDRRYPHAKKWDRNAILEDYKSGVPVAEIYEKYNISQTHLNRLRKDAEIPLRPRPSLVGKKNGQYKHGLGSRTKERDRYLKYQVAAACLGHVVPKGWVLHHINDDPNDNYPENLMIFPSRSAHARYHQRQLSHQHEGLEVNAIQLGLENGGWLLPQPDHLIVLPHEIDRLYPPEKKEMPRQDQK